MLHPLFQTPEFQNTLNNALLSMFNQMESYRTDETDIHMIEIQFGENKIRISEKDIQYLKLNLVWLAPVK